MLSGLFIVLILSCQPTATAVLATNTNPIAGSAPDLQFPDTAALKRSVQDLLDKMPEAIAPYDATAIYMKMTREVTGRCTIE